MYYFLNKNVAFMFNSNCYCKIRTQARVHTEAIITSTLAVDWVKVIARQLHVHISRLHRNNASATSLATTHPKTKRPTSQNGNNNPFCNVFDSVVAIRIVHIFGMRGNGLLFVISTTNGCSLSHVPFFHLTNYPAKISEII